MAGLQLSGLASGLDWKSITDQLMAVSRAPITRLRQEQTQIDSRNNALGEVRNLLVGLQNSLNSLNTNSSLDQRTATLSNTSSGWTASADNGAATGSWSINVTSLATAARREGTTNVASGIAPTNDVSTLLLSNMRTAQTVTAGNFTVNGQSVTVAATDTLQDVFDKISTATGGAVTGSYDASTDRVTLSSASTITLGSSADTSNFLSAVKLFNNGSNTINSSSSLGVARLSTPLTNAGLATAITNNDGAGNSSFTINGKTITYNVNTDSIQSVMTKINNSEAGVTASYDAALDRFVLTNKNTGDVGIFLSETGTGFLTATGLAGGTTVAGTNATFTVNGGGSITSTSNTLDSSLTGIAGLTITAGSTGTQTVTIGANTDAAKSAIESVISAYNSFQAAVDKHTQVTTNGAKVTAGPLAGNRDITDLSNRVRSLIFAEGGNVNNNLRRLADMGIDFTGSGSSLSVKNATLLSQKLATSSSDIKDLFQNTTNGLIKTIDDYVQKQTGSGGLFPTQTNNLTKQRADLDQRIEEIERQLTRQRELLENSFIQMERSQSFWQQQGAMLANSLPSAISGKK